MRLHAKVIEELIKIYTNYGGFQDDSKLRHHLSQVDLTPYERKSTENQEVILVLTKDYLEALNKKRP